MISHHTREQSMPDQVDERGRRDKRHVHSILLEKTEGRACLTLLVVGLRRRCNLPPPPPLSPPSFSLPPVVYKSLLMSLCSFVMVQETCKFEHFLQENCVSRQDAHEKVPRVFKTPSGCPGMLTSLKHGLIVTQQAVLHDANSCNLISFAGLLDRALQICIGPQGKRESPKETWEGSGFHTGNTF